MIVQLGWRAVGNWQTNVKEFLIEEARYPAVEIVPCDDMIAGFKHRGNSIDGRHAAGEHARRRSAFERSQIRLQPVTRRIRYARIFITFVLSDFFLNVGGSRVDGDVNGPSGRIGFLAGVDGTGCKARMLQVFSWEVTSTQVLLNVEC